MKTFLLCLIACISVSSYAGEAITDPGKIVRLHYWQGIDAILVIPEKYAANVGCTKNGQYALSKSHPYFNELFSMMLAAAASKASVQFTVNNSECIGEYPYIKNFYYTP